MSTVHYYQIDLKQGDLQLQLMSDDADFIGQQMHKWFCALLNDSSLPPPPAPPAYVAPEAPSFSEAPELVEDLPLFEDFDEEPQEESLAPVFDKEPSEQPVNNLQTSVENAPTFVEAPSMETAASPEEFTESPTFEQPVENLSAHVETVEDIEDVSFLSPASEDDELDLIMDTLMADMAIQEEPQPTFEPEPLPIQEKESIISEMPPDLALEAAFEEELQGLFEEAPQEDIKLSPDNFEGPVQALPEPEMAAPPPIIEEDSFESVFSEVLGNTSDTEDIHLEQTSSASAPFQNAVVDEEVIQVESMAELCDLAPNASKGEDFLVLAAYFLSQIKKMDKYALKDLNAQLVRAGLTPVNHGILENAISQNYLQLVPDLTGNASTAEYALTATGLAYGKGLMTA